MPCSPSRRSDRGDKSAQDEYVGIVFWTKRIVVARIAMTNHRPHGGMAHRSASTHRTAHRIAATLADLHPQLKKARYVKNRGAA